MGGTVGGILEWDTARREGRNMEVANKDAALLQQDMFNQIREDQQPWRDAGIKSLAGLSNGEEFRDFTMEDFEADPGYQFRLDEGMKAIERSAAARGGLNSTSTMQGLANFNQGIASEEYNNAFNRFNANRDARYNRMANLAGIGQVATNQVGSAGQNFANQYGMNMVNAANARAAGNIGGLKAFNEGVNNDSQLMMQGAGMMFCDENLKENITTVSNQDLKELSEVIKPVLFNYRDEVHGKGNL